MQNPKLTKTSKFIDKLLPYIIYLFCNFLVLFFFYLIMTKVVYRPLERNDEVEEVIKDTVVDRSHIYEDIEFSEEALKLYLKDINIKFPEVVLAQAKLESGNFKSKLFIEHNNMFGMRVAKQRPTLADDKNTGYASYQHWRSSVLDYAYYQSRYLKQYNTKEKYLNRLGQVYAEDPNYVSKLKILMN